MCGICGFTNANANDIDILKAMCDVMKHRGPDGEGQFIQNGIALGHRRLSLIDLENGAQPMLRSTNECVGTVCSSAQAKLHTYPLALVFNGEIYNYQDLKEELETQGWQFSSNSDTEVILVGYLAWGKALLNKLRGMFAFAIWDNNSKELFLARDFFGIKPLYYTLQQGTFIFASEIKSILEHPAYTKELNYEALEQYLCFQFSALEESFFKGIYKLPPAHCMSVHADGTYEIEQYWKPSFTINETISKDDYVHAIMQEMQESVQYHNVADVEVGSFLSSGIDSSYMAACLCKENPAIKTFTVGFSEYRGERDEISWAKELAADLHVMNFSKHITEEEYWDVLEKVQWHMDEPSADPSAIALYFVDKLAAEQVKAVLSGEGADEFFGGYKIYQTPFENQKLAWCPKPILKTAAKLTEVLGIRGTHYLQRAASKPEDWYYTNANGVAFNEAERARLLKRAPHCPSPQELVASTYQRASGLDDMTRMQYVDIHFWLVGDILLKTDKMSMAHSLESRVPFLDKKVFELASSMPTHLKANSTQTKIALREAAENTIPQAWAQKEKLGFPVPLVKWLREDAYYEQIKTCFSSELAQTFFNTNYLLSLLDEHRAGADNSRKIWIVYMFLIWYKVFFIDKKH